MKILAIIPARGGSKGVPGKNIKLLAGKPLIQYTIEASLGAELLTDIIVSTDSNDIAQIAVSLGANVPFIRPGHLASDTASSVDVVAHAVGFLRDKGRTYDAVCLLQPTCPFRKKGFIDKAIERFIEAGTDSLISVLPLPNNFNPHWIFEKTGNDHLRIATGEKEIIKRRHDLPQAFYRDGSIYLTRTSVITNQGSLYGDTISYLVSEKQYYVNIDTIEDWSMAEEIAARLKMQIL
ncbi:MAG TPA: acylneuraminate cytidylyltransferase [Bacteroidales bacterium]|nr:acylneuraminate cytidylyltransferase [Bacteroidales bacterium]